MALVPLFVEAIYPGDEIDVLSVNRFQVVVCASRTDARPGTHCVRCCSMWFAVKANPLSCLNPDDLNGLL